jgi:phosphohistidine swiveling domain-containing protein
MTEEVGGEEDLLRYLKQKKWFFSALAKESFFLYTLELWDREKLMKKENFPDFVETLLVPLKDDYPIRLFNSQQAKKFHKGSLNKLKKNPKIILDYLNKGEQVWKKIFFFTERLNKTIKEDDYKSSLNIFEEIIKLYGEHGNLFFINFSFGRVLFDHQKEFKNDVQIYLKKHDVWRNKFVFNEERLENIFYHFLKYLMKQKKYQSKPSEFFKFLSAKEILNIARENIDETIINKTISQRKKSQFIYVYLNPIKHRTVIDNKKTVDAIQKYFVKQLNNQQNALLIKGQVVYNNKDVIKGTVINIKDKYELEKINKLEMKDKILVTIQATPHFFPYLKDIKAIITDEGGITCHAAIIAREFGKPCIVGTGNATKILKRGNLVEVNFNRGVVKILEQA